MGIQLLVLLFGFLLMKRIVEETASQVSIVLTVKPRYLVLDTNCFISCRPELQLLVDTGHFVIVVPLVGRSQSCSSPMHFYCSHCR